MNLSPSSSNTCALLQKRPAPTDRQRGIATLITLIALLVMIISVLALIRSSDTTAVIAGNIAFRRDLTNEAQRVIPVVQTLFSTGALSGGPASSTRWSNLSSSNYSATTLASNNQGIPNALLNDKTFASVGSSGNDIVDTTAGVTIRYVVDRLCSSTALNAAATSTTCVQGYAGIASGGTAGITQAGGNFSPAYRVSVRVTGPRNTQAFMQATLEVN